MSFDPETRFGPIRAERIRRIAHCHMTSAVKLVVLGGGITGALVAHRLVRDGVSVVLIDSREVGYGSTAASTGLLQYEIDTPLVDLIKKVGEKHAVHAYRRGLTAIDEIDRLVAPFPSPCGFSRRDTLHLCGSRWHVRRLKREYECRRKLGFDVAYQTRQELAATSSIRAPGAIQLRGARSN